MTKVSLYNVKQNSPAEIRHAQENFTEATGTITQRAGTVHIEGAAAGVALAFGYDGLKEGDELLIVNTSANYSADITLPAGSYWDASNNTVATLPDTSALLVRAISSTRFYVIVNNGSVTFA